MSARRRLARARWICGGLLALAVWLGLAVSTGFCIIPFLAGGFGYMLWRIQFACPRCGTTYLYETKSGFMGLPRFFGKACRNCGLSHDEAFSKVRQT